MVGVYYNNVWYPNEQHANFARSQDGVLGTSVNNSVTPSTLQSGSSILNTSTGVGGVSAGDVGSIGLGSYSSSQNFSGLDSALQARGVTPLTTTTLSPDAIKPPPAITDPTAMSGFDKGRLGLAAVQVGMDLANFGTEKELAETKIDALKKNIGLAESQYQDKKNATKALGNAFA